MSIKVDRALYGPSLFEITLGMFLSILLGAALAVCFLIFKPVEVVIELPKENDRIAGQVYYIEGSRDSGRAKQWRRKRQLLSEGKPGEISITEEELYAWFSGGDTQAVTEKKPVAAKPSKAIPPSASGAPKQGDVPIPDEIVVVAEPNFRIHEGMLQIGFPTTINLLTLSFPVVFQAQGIFEKKGDMFMYEPQSVLIGSLPVHRIPGAVSYLTKRAFAAQSFPAEGLDAWRKVSAVSLEGRTLKLTIPQ